MVDNNSLETIWDGLLSKEADKVRFVYLQLDKEYRLHTISHLKRMVEDEGWHPLQKEAAQAALDYIQELKDNKERE